MKTRALATAVTGLAMAFASFGSANAALVTDWDATVTGEWGSYSPTGVDKDSSKKLSWGTPVNSGGDRSSLEITDPAASQSVQTQISGNSPQPGTTADGVTLTHNNNPITGTTLDSAVLEATLDLQAAAPPGETGGPGTLPPLSYDILFSETTNSTPCVAGSPSGNPCNDIFVQQTGFLDQQLTYNGNDYFLNIFPTAGGTLQTLSDDVCGAAGAGSGCIGFTTVEGQSNNLPFGFTISAERFSTDVPAPGSLALLGLGLIAAGATCRRRKQS